MKIKTTKNTVNSKHRLITDQCPIGDGVCRETMPDGSITTDCQFYIDIMMGCTMFFDTGKIWIINRTIQMSMDLQKMV